MSNFIFDNNIINDLLKYLQENEYIWRKDISTFKMWNQIWIYLNEINKLIEYFNGFNYLNIEVLNDNKKIFSEFILNIQLLKDIIIFFSNIFNFKMKENAIIKCFKNIWINKDYKVYKLKISENNNDNYIFSFLRSSFVAHRPKVEYKKSINWILNEKEFLVNFDFWFIENSSNNFGLHLLLKQNNISNCIVGKFLICNSKNAINNTNYVDIYFSFNSYIDYIKSLYSYINKIKFFIQKNIESWKKEKKSLKIDINDKDLISKLKTIKNKLENSSLSVYLIDKFIYMFSSYEKYNKINKKFIDDYLKWIDSFLIKLSKKLEKTVDYNKIEEFESKYEKEIFGFPNININGMHNHLSYCYEKINRYIYKNKRTINDIAKMNWSNSSSNEEEWGLRCLFVFYEFFAKQYVYMNLNKMSFNELYLLIHVSMFKYKQGVKNV